MQTTWISCNVFKWNLCNISWTYAGWQPGTMGQSANTQDRYSTDTFSHTALQSSTAVFYCSVRTSMRKDGLGAYFCCTLPVWPWPKLVCQAEMKRWWHCSTGLWKHFNDWWWDVCMELIQGKLYPRLDANQLWSRRGLVMVMGWGGTLGYWHTDVALWLQERRLLLSRQLRT